MTEAVTTELKRMMKDGFDQGYKLGVEHGVTSMVKALRAVLDVTSNGPVTREMIEAALDGASSALIEASAKLAS